MPANAARKMMYRFFYGVKVVYGSSGVTSVATASSDSTRSAATVILLEKLYQTGSCRSECFFSKCVLEVVMTLYGPLSVYFGMVAIIVGHHEAPEDDLRSHCQTLRYARRWGLPQR